jgi:serine/threonine protein kinase
LVKVNGVDYKIEEDIGSGGSCVVYRALQMKKNGQRVALKIVDLSKADSELTKIFENEIQFLEQLQGSNYVIEMIDQ